MSAPLRAFIGALDIPYDIMAAAGASFGSVNVATGVTDCISVPSGTPGIVMDFGSQTDVWIAWYMSTGGVTPTLDRIFWELKDTAGNIVAQLRVGSAAVPATIRFYRNVGGTMTLTTTTVGGELIGTPVRFDVHINLTAGTFSLYRNGGADVIAYTGSLNNGGAITDLRSVAFMATRGSGNNQFAAMWADTLDTRSAVWDEISTSAAGFYAEQASGVEADIDELGTLTFTDKIIMNAVGQRSLFTQTGQSAAYSTGYDVQCLLVGAYALKVTGGKLAGMIRSGTTDDEGPPVELNLTGAGVQAIFANNPDGAVPWTYATVGAAQFGFRAKAA